MTTTGDKAVFARFAQNHGVSPEDLANLVTLGNRCGRAQERECSVNSDAVRLTAQHARELFEAAAQRLGYTAAYTGLYPCLLKDGRYIDLPY